ncbi:hypothetical protein [Breoghania sp.]|uniref:hypothetical protein n=1 Tax=Breoghania sp. TaxID=2065378 RepID=UPI0026305C40|nr:hypothetical protein [Breoghania sp.]MDJ0930727.1 hypothetical protein [Breoghania sp.]
MKANAGVAGAAMQGQKDDPNAMEFSNYLFAAGGDYLDGDDIVLNSDAGVTTLDLYVDAIQNAAQISALSATLNNTIA